MPFWSRKLTDEQVKAGVIERRIAKINEAPDWMLPDGAAKNYLIERAKAGDEVYCYLSGQEWQVYIDRVRVPLREWVWEYNHTHGVIPLRQESAY